LEGKVVTERRKRDEVGETDDLIYGTSRSSDNVGTPRGRLMQRAETCKDSKAKEGACSECWFADQLVGID